MPCLEHVLMAFRCALVARARNLNGYLLVSVELVNRGKAFQVARELRKVAFPGNVVKSLRQKHECVPSNGSEWPTHGRDESFFLRKISLLLQSTADGL